MNIEDPTYIPESVVWEQEPILQKKNQRTIWFYTGIDQSEKLKNGHMADFSFSDWSIPAYSPIVS